MGAGRWDATRAAVVRRGQGGERGPRTRVFVCEGVRRTHYGVQGHRHDDQVEKTKGCCDKERLSHNITKIFFLLFQQNKYGGLNDVVWVVIRKGVAEGDKDLAVGPFAEEA